VTSQAELARQGVEAYNRGDLEALVERADPEITMVPVRALLEGGEYRGHEGIRRFLADMEEDWERREIVVDEIRELDDGVLVLGTFKAVGRSGNEVSQPVAWHTRYRDGKLLRLVAYTDQETALRRLGRSG
jgi:ketosteroid isomerase-like protein